jgi:hypothetical protein
VCNAEGRRAFLSEITNFVMRYASAAQGELAVERLARWDESVTVIADKSLQEKEGKNHSDGCDCKPTCLESEK